MNIELLKNLSFLDTDSYKFSHNARFGKTQFPDNVEYAMAYIEARKKDHVLFFGLQYILKQLKLPTAEDIEFADKIISCHMGPDIFNKEAWLGVVELGFYPLKINAVPEGTVINSHEVLATVENTVPGFAWLVGWFETMFLRVWYPTTVATKSFEIKNLIRSYLEKNGDVAELDFALHDFGSRGTTCSEQAGIGGLAHLINFKGTDTFASFLTGIEYYNVDLERFAFSIPASEHSTITSWGEEGEEAAYLNMIEKFGGADKKFACVSDSNNIWEALKIWKKLEPALIEKGGCLVVRPDSGDPVETPVKVIESLLDLFGYTVNYKGYKLLPSYLRVIQGDGIDYDSIQQILEMLDSKKISASNIVFGMGGALLQKLNRDTYGFAYKVSSVTINGKERDVFKNPIGDKSKKSKKGRLTLDQNKKTVLIRDLEGPSFLKTVYRNGHLVNEETFKNIRNNSKA